jgi:hypothetical protein
MLDPAVTIHVASTHAGDSMVLSKDSRWQSPTSIERYASNLSLWLSGTKDMLVHTLSCMHACIPWRIQGSQLQAAPTRSQQAVVMSARASDAMKPAYSMTRLRIGDVADD